VRAPNPTKPLPTLPAARVGFFLAAYDWLVDNCELDKDQKKF
jgi:hypothetical protein